MKPLTKSARVFSIAVLATLILASCRTHYKPVLSSNLGVNFKVAPFKEGLSLAKSDKKPLFVFIHASWCPTCKKEEQEVLVQERVGSPFNKKFVNVAIDLDSKDGKDFQKEYPVHATPTLFFFNPDGTLAQKIEGFATSDTLLSATAQLAANY